MRVRTKNVIKVAIIVAVTSGVMAAIPALIFSLIFSPPLWAAGLIFLVLWSYFDNKLGEHVTSDPWVRRRI